MKEDPAYLDDKPNHSLDKAAAHPLELVLIKKGDCLYPRT